MPRTCWPLFRLCIALATLGWLSPGAQASGPRAPDNARAADAAGIQCIEVEVNGERVPDYGCFSRLLAGTATGETSLAAMTASDRMVRRAPSELGLANRAATHQRMGNAFGKSTTPQRPPPPAPRPVVPGR